MERRRRIFDRVSPLSRVTLQLDLDRLPSDSGLTRDELELFRQIARGDLRVQDLPADADRWIECGVLVVSNDKVSPDRGAGS